MSGLSTTAQWNMSILSKMLSVRTKKNVTFGARRIRWHRTVSVPSRHWAHTEEVMKDKTKLFGIFFYHIEKDTKEVGEKVKNPPLLLLLLFRHKTNIKALRSRGSRGLSQEANRFFVCCASPDIAAAGGILWNDLRHPTGENETMRTPLHLSRQFFVFFKERKTSHTNLRPSCLYCVGDITRKKIDPATITRVAPPPLLPPRTTKEYRIDLFSSAVAKQFLFGKTTHRDIYCIYFLKDRIPFGVPVDASHQEIPPNCVIRGL